MPTMYFFREFVTAGGLISYGTKLADGYHQLGVYTGKVLKGAKPADLPIIQQSEKNRADRQSQDSKPKSRCLCSPAPRSSSDAA
jgi:hypothetical protein